MESTTSTTTRILTFAIITRLCVILWACIAAAIGSSYDTSRFITAPLTGVSHTSNVVGIHPSLLSSFLAPKQQQNFKKNDLFETSPSQLPFPELDSFLDRYIVGPLCVWDGVYFVHIAEYGYTYEHFHAFFPMYPAVVRLAR